MGTPDIAAQSLAALIDAGHEICAVYTRADKPVGRKQVLTAPPVKQLAVRRGIPVYQPATLRDGEAERVFRALAPDLVVVVAYGRILPPELLHIARLGCINLHVSLLPKYRGSAPIQWAVIHGDAETGVTIMQLDEGCDTGDILMVEKVAIGRKRPPANCSTGWRPSAQKRWCGPSPCWTRASLPPKSRTTARQPRRPCSKKRWRALPLTSPPPRFTI